MTLDTLPAGAIWVCIVALSANFCLFFMAQSLCLATLRRVRTTMNDRRKPAAARAVATAPFISIHVPAYDEPSELLADTLNSLAKIKYPYFEVIVLDNNTPDPSTWRPVESLCLLLGPRFRFFHVDQLTGAKAGALNVCLANTDDRAEFIAVVDADYRVEPHFLAVAMENIAKSGASFVQFPQAFRHVAGGGGNAVALELEDYFSFLGGHDDRVCAPLLTGTMSVISIDALKRAGGWSDTSVTEDAELGLRLFRQGDHGIFVDRIVGRGLLPMSLAGLKTQRHRWICGNVQSLLGALGGADREDRPGTVSVLAQLLAWPAFWLLPIVFLVATAWDATPGATMEFAIELASLTILMSPFTTILRRLMSRGERTPFWRGLAGPLAVKCALIWVSSSAWLETLFRSRIAFEKTPKTRAKQAKLGVNPVFGILTSIAAILYFSHGDLLASAACALGALSWPAALWVDRGLRQQGPDRISSGSSNAMGFPCTA